MTGLKEEGEFDWGLKDRKDGELAMTSILGRVVFFTFLGQWSPFPLKLEEKFLSRLNVVHLEILSSFFHF